MYKEKILKFGEEQIINVPIKDTSDEIKFERKKGDLSKYFGENDTIEFDDSAAGFLNIKTDANLLESLRTLKVKITRGDKETDLSKESYHCISMINKCIMSFFLMGE